MSYESKGPDSDPTPSDNKYQIPRPIVAPSGLEAPLSAHIGATDVRKAPKGSDNPLHPKHFEQHVVMKLPEGPIGHPLTGKPIDPTEHQNQTVFSSVIGAAIAGQNFCPLWRLIPIQEESGKIVLGVRTKFMENFGSLADAQY